MAAQNGKDLLIKVDMDNAGSFETLAGLRASRISLNAQTVDVTHMESVNGWRELLEGGGVKTASISGSGVFRDEDTDLRANQIFFAGSTPEFQVIVPDFATFEGKFQITSLEYAGQYEGEATYELSLSSAGLITYSLIQ